MKFFTSDTHFYHKNITRYCDRPCPDVPTNNEMLINNWNDTVRPEDEVYHLGDFGFGSLSKLCAILERLNGRKYLIKGNHDYHCKKEAFRKHWEWIRDKYILKVQDPEVAKGRQEIVMCHEAFYVWTGSHRGTWNLFGHSHGTLDEWARDGLHIDVGVDSEHAQYRPMSYEQIKKIMSTKKVKLVDHHNEETNP